MTENSRCGRRAPSAAFIQPDASDQDAVTIGGRLQLDSVLALIMIVLVVQAGGTKSHLCFSLCHQAPMFSWPRLREADPVLRCEMASTGEVSPQKICDNLLFYLIRLNGQFPVSSVFLCFLEGGLFWTKHLHSLPEGHALHRLQATAEGHPDRDSGRTKAIWNSAHLLFSPPVSFRCVLLLRNRWLESLRLVGF